MTYIQLTSAVTDFKGLIVVVVAGAYTGFLLSLELASLLECRRGPVHTLGKATAGE